MYKYIHKHVYTPCQRYIFRVLYIYHILPPLFALRQLFQIKYIEIIFLGTRFFYHLREFRLLRWYYSFSITTQSEGKYKFCVVDFLPLCILEKLL